jgi:hypothetical protein
LISGLSKKKKKKKKEEKEKETKKRFTAEMDYKLLQF